MGLFLSKIGSCLRFLTHNSGTKLRQTLNTRYDSKVTGAKVNGALIEQKMSNGLIFNIDLLLKNSPNFELSKQDLD